MTMEPWTADSESKFQVNQRHPGRIPISLHFPTSARRHRRPLLGVADHGRRDAMLRPRALHAKP